MKHLFLLLLMIGNSFIVNAQQTTSSIATARLGFPGSMVLIPIDSLRTAYYICGIGSTIDLHIIPNDSLDQLVSNWKKGVYEPKNLDPRITLGHNIYIKPYSEATPEVIKEVSSTVRFNWIKSFSITKIEEEEEALVKAKL
ncbi:MAG: hypothetical protein R2800_06545 [Flavipsychrobacter sp.]